MDQRPGQPLLRIPLRFVLPEAATGAESRHDADGEALRDLSRRTNGTVPNYPQLSPRLSNYPDGGRLEAAATTSAAKRSTVSGAVSHAHISRQPVLPRKV